MRKAPWNDKENAAVVRLYFDMLSFAIPGHKYNKAGMIRSYQFSGGRCEHPEALSERSRGSIEAKLMNCSAAHRDLGAAITMDGFGYRCLANYQSALKDAIKAELVERQFRADVATSQANEQRAGA
jgi:hypothetical protein